MGLLTHLRGWVQQRLYPQLDPEHEKRAAEAERRLRMQEREARLTYLRAMRNIQERKRVEE